MRSPSGLNEMPVGLENFPTALPLVPYEAECATKVPIILSILILLLPESATPKRKPSTLNATSLGAVSRPSLADVDRLDSVSNRCDHACGLRRLW